MDFAIEATGVARAAEAAFFSLGKRGKMVNLLLLSSIDELTWSRYKLAIMLLAIYLYLSVLKQIELCCMLNDSCSSAASSVICAPSSVAQRVILTRLSLSRNWSK